MTSRPWSWGDSALAALGALAAPAVLPVRHVLVGPLLARVPVVE